MANVKGNSTAGHNMTHAQATQKFSDKTFQFARTNRKAKDLIIDHQYMVECLVLDPTDDEWCSVRMKFKDFIKDKPELISE